MTYVFVHGAFHGAWCWSAVEERLRAAGHRTISIDLPRGGEDRTPIAEVSLASVTQRAVVAIDAEDEPVVLVAHSAGGLPVSMAVEARPDRVARVVFVTAALLGDGEALLPALGERDPDSFVHQDGVLLPDMDTGELRYGREHLARVFYSTCTPEQAAWAAERVNDPIAIAPLATPVALSAERFGSVPRSFVVALRDQVLTQGFQRSMADAWDGTDVHEIDTDHSPFLCAPDDLTGILLGLG
jgi:pimeloyl-ACP methyl ester carboxylesterase